MSLADVAFRPMPTARMLILIPMILPLAVALVLSLRQKGRPPASNRHLAVVCVGALIVALGALLPMPRPVPPSGGQALTLPLLPGMDLVWRQSQGIPILSLLWIAATLGYGKKLKHSLPEDAIARLEAGLALLIAAAACATLAANALTLCLGVGLTALCLGGLAANRMPCRRASGGLRALGALPACLDKGLDQAWAATARLTIRLGQGCPRLERLPLWGRLALTFTCLALSLLGLHLLLVVQGEGQ